jgi:ABC-type branched-subunit amino acid transport system permease subunit
MKRLKAIFKNNWWLVLMAVILGIVVPTLNGWIDNKPTLTVLGICFAMSLVAFGILKLFKPVFIKDKNKDDK